MSSESACPTVRAVASTPPPGGYGTTRRSGLDGKACDCACSAVGNNAIATSIVETNLPLANAVRLEFGVPAGAAIGWPRAMLLRVVIAVHGSRRFDRQQFVLDILRNGCARPLLRVANTTAARRLHDQPI